MDKSISFKSQKGMKDYEVKSRSLSHGPLLPSSSVPKAIIAFPFKSNYPQREILKRCKNLFLSSVLLYIWLESTDPSPHI